jgi:hypothetical protein
VRFGVPPVGNDIDSWANDLRRWLARTWDNLTFKDAAASATQDGTLLWDPVGGHPVVSKGGEWRQIVLANGTAILGQDVDINAAAADTAYKIPFDAIELSDITLTGSPLTDITFNESGLYLITFTAQAESTSAARVDFRFWPRINNVDISGSTIVSSLHSNGSTMVVTRTALFQINAGDMLNAMWAATATSGRLKAHAATAYAPSSPSVTMAITTIRA